MFKQPKSCFVVLILGLLGASVSAWTPSLAQSNGGGSTFRKVRAFDVLNFLPSISDSMFEQRVNVKKASTALEMSSTSQSSSSSVNSYEPLFDFSLAETFQKIDRLDDAIMGGISTSTVMNFTDPMDNSVSYAKWFGVCRTDGGGFCGFRTNPFTEPLQVGDSDGFYIKLRLASDSDSHRRVWKVSTRVKPDRGEQLYQAPFKFDQTTDDDQWTTVKIPFESFTLVRGPRVVKDAPPLNTTGGLYQFGMTMSKFKPGENLTELENFRDGFFELQLQEIGLYYNEKERATTTTTTTQEAIQLPPVLSKAETKKKRPLLFKLMIPFFSLFVSEKIQRRRSAMRILREKRGLSRAEAILFGLKSRKNSCGVVPALARTLSILISDALRTSIFVVLRVAVYYPLVAMNRTIKFVKSLFAKNEKGAQ